LHARGGAEENLICGRSQLLSAARCGDAEVMQYAHRNGCDLDNMVGTAVSGNHNLPCLQYYLEHTDTTCNKYQESTICCLR